MRVGICLPWVRLLTTKSSMADRVLGVGAVEVVPPGERLAAERVSETLGVLIV